MGVVNVTPDSFSDGGEHFAPENAIKRGLTLAEEGADIIDIGGESTRPGAESVGAEEELRRVIPVVEGLSGKINAQRSTKFISIDTSKAEVARAAIEAGAVIVNDVTGGRGDTEMMQLVARDQSRRS